MLYLPHLSSCLQNEGDNNNSFLLEVLAELNVIIYVRFSDRYLAKISSPKKSSYYSIPYLAQASWGQERHSSSRPSYSAWHTWILNQYLFSPSPSSSTHVFSRQKFPGVNCISADRNSEVYPHSASVHLHLSSNTVSSPGEGPPSYGPNCCRFSWTAGTSYPKLCEFAERRWLLSPLPLPGLWGKGPEALSTTLKQRKWTSTQGQLKQTCPCLQRVEENGNCHWGLPWWSSS